MTKKNLVVILPAYNEGKYIKQVLKNLNQLNYQYIVIDDGSSDQTEKICADLAPVYLRHKVNLGKGSALKTGCEYAFKNLKAEAVIFMDSDGQHDPLEIDLFVKQINNGHDLVFGVRTFGKEMPLIRIIGNRLASYLVWLLFGRYIPDIPSGYKAMTKKAYNKIQWQATDYGVELEIAVRTAKSKLLFKEVEIKTIYHDLDRGMTLLDTWKMIFHMLLWRISL